MSACKWCGKDSTLTKHGYCESCNSSIRSDIKTNKAILENLSEEAAPFLSDGEKNQILKKTQQAYSKLKDYKDKKIPFFKSDIEFLKNNIYIQLGKPVQATETRTVMEGKNNKSSYFWPTLIAIVIVTITIVFSMQLANHAKNPQRDRQISLMTAAQSAVKSNLKSPSSAKFPWGLGDYHFAQSPDNSNVFVVTSHVDSENSFGASLRSVFVVKLEYNFDTDRYRVLDVAIS